MKSSSKAFVLIAAPIFGLIAAGSATTRVNTPPVAEATHTAQREYVDTPPTWVSFSADLRRVYESDGSVFIGRTLVSSDGSSRNETGRPSEPVNSIAIKSIPQKTFYRWTPQEGWTSQAMDLPPDGWNPLPVVLNARMSRVDTTVEGFRLIQVKSAGRTFFQAPDLNMFTLVTLVMCRHDPAATCGTWYSNIKLAEPPTELFVPPQGVKITRLPGSGGIVRMDK
jgi:hypothetical protein